LLLLVGRGLPGYAAATYKSLPPLFPACHPIEVAAHRKAPLLASAKRGAEWH